MAPSTKQKWKVGGTITISAGALLTALAWGAPKAATVLDATYVRRDTFAVFQADLTRRTATDSVALLYELRELQMRVVRLDSTIRRCAKHPDTC